MFGHSAFKRGGFKGVINLAAVVGLFMTNKSNCRYTAQDLIEDYFEKKIVGHHIMSTVDHRAKYVAALSKKEHDDIHAKIGMSNHNLAVYIPSCEKLENYMNLLDSVEYMLSFSNRNDKERKLMKRRLMNNLQRIQSQTTV